MIDASAYFLYQGCFGVVPVTLIVTRRPNGSIFNSPYTRNLYSFAFKRLLVMCVKDAQDIITPIKGW
jgi:hypothetical protein